MMNNYIKQTQHFLLELISIYSDISALLRKIPINPSTSSKTLLSLTEAVEACNCIDRGIKREHELRLFRETFTLIKHYLQLPQKVKKIDIVIKFNLVTRVLSTRLREQLVTSEALKVEILEHIEKEREQLLRWAETKKGKEEVIIKKKQTDNYVLNFIFTDTRPTNQHPTPASPLPPPNKPPPQPALSRQSPSKAHLPASHTAALKQKQNVPRLVRQSARRITERRTDFLERSTVPWKRNNKLTEGPQVQVTVCGQISESKATDMVVGSQKGGIAEQEKQNFDILKLKKKEKHLTIDSKFADQESHRGEDSCRDKNSQFHISQRYLRSRKTIESASHFSSKIKKKSGFLLEKEQEIRDAPTTHEFIHQELVFHPSKFKARQFLTHCQNQSDRQDILKTKSEKTLEKIQTEEPIVKNKALRRSQKQPTNSRRRSSLRSKTSLMESDTRKESLLLKKSEFFNLSSLKIDAEASVPVEERPEEKNHQSNLKNYYQELSGMRNDIQTSCDAWLKDFSVFFWHQNILSQEQNRHIRKILAKRKYNYPPGEFDIRFSTSQRPLSATYSAQEDAFIVAMRKHLSECSGLGQAGLFSD